MKFKSASGVLFCCGILIASAVFFNANAPQAKAIIKEVLIAGTVYNFLAEGEEPIGEECEQDGYSYTKPSPGIGPMPCGSNQCRPNGYLYFTACLTESDCNQLGGTTDGGNKAGCTDQDGRELFCCRTLKNRCNPQSKDPNKVYLCTKEQQCTGSDRKVYGKGFNCTGDYATCCEIDDSPKAPMKIIGEPLLKGTSEDPTGTGGGLSGRKAKRSYEHLDNFCHTATECGEVGGTFEEGFGCPFKGDQPQGYCVAPDVEYELQKPIFGVTKISGLRDFIKILFNGSIGVLIIISALFFIWGAFKYLVSAVATSIQNSKEIMVDALVGLALGLGAFALLSNINPNLLNLSKQKVHMINRVSFYDVVYCEDLVNQDAKLMYAGTPKAPLSYTQQLEKTGFDTSIDDAECGKEYFIEGADTMAVCMGTGCEGGGDTLCINCTTGLGDECESNSAIEHACTDCKFGGNIKASEAFVPEQVWLYLFCNKESSEGVDVIADELINLDITHDDANEVDGADASGYVLNYCAKDFGMTEQQVQEFFDDDDCNNSTESGMMLFVDIEMEFTFDIDDQKKHLQQRFENNPKQMALIAALPALGGVVPTIVALTLDSQIDNLYFPINKDMCKTNLFESSVGLNEAFLESAFNPETTAFEGMMEAYGKQVRDDYKTLIKNAWSPEEAKEIIRKNAKSSCGFTVD